MQARFDFAGALIPPTEDLPTHLGLHHHGEEPEVRVAKLEFYTTWDLKNHKMQHLSGETST